MKRILPILMLVLVIVASLGGCSKGEERASNEIVEAFVGDLSAQVSATGQVLPRRQATLSFGTPGIVQEVAVEVGDRVQAGDVLARLDDAALQRAVRSAEQNLRIQEANLSALRTAAPDEDIAAARAAVAAAQARLDDLLAGPSEEELADAQAQLAAAQAQLDDLLAGPAKEDLVAARAALAAAQAQLKVEAARYAAVKDRLTVARCGLDMAAIDLESAQYFYDALKNDWQHKDYADFSPEAERLQDAQDAYAVALARYNVNAVGINDLALRNAQAQVAQAQARLAALTDPREAEVAAAREQVAAAQANLAALTDGRATEIAAARAQLAQAQANLSDLLAGTSAEKLAAAQAQVERARLQLADARDRLTKASITAPFDGVITAVHVQAGEQAGGPAIEMADLNGLEVVLEVDEVDIGAVAVGQRAVVTLEPWPDRKLEGEVATITPKANAGGDLITYEVHIKVNWQDSPPARIGMTANADLITMSREKVVLVPNRAIIAGRVPGRYMVYRLRGDKVERVPVKIGLRDAQYTEITEGVRAGDKLVVGYTPSSRPPRPEAKSGRPE